MFFQYLVFFGLSFVALSSALVVVASKNPVASVIFLIIKLFALAGIYAQLGADFLAAIQIIVYAGAIMVLFMFVIMLLNLTREKNPAAAPIEWFVALTAGLSFLIFSALLFFGLTSTKAELEVPVEQVTGNTDAIASQLFTVYLWPFELASLLILLAIVASVVIAKKNTVIASAGDQQLAAAHQGDKK